MRSTHRLRPEKPQSVARGRGFESRHLHERSHLPGLVHTWFAGIQDAVARGLEQDPILYVAKLRATVQEVYRQVAPGTKVYTGHKLPPPRAKKDEKPDEVFTLTTKAFRGGARRDQTRRP